VGVNSGAMSISVTSTGVASLARESNGTVVVKCRRSICGILQGSVVLRRGMWHGSNEGYMVFMRSDYTRALVRIDARYMKILGMT